MANVKTMGGRRSRYWCGPGSVRANQNGARLSESGSGAPRIFVTSVLLTRSAKRSHVPPAILSPGLFLEMVIETRSLRRTAGSPSQ